MMPEDSKIEFLIMLKMVLTISFSSKHIKSKFDTLIKGKISCHVIPIFESIDINTEQDMIIAETYIKSNKFI